jgi:DNA-binding NtrC family response regulator
MNHPAAVPVRPAARSNAWQQYSVLIVDDEEGMRSFLHKTLAGRCALVETAGSAEEGRTLFNRIHFDLIILDISLPGKSGVEWLDELREGGFQGDVILITAFADIDTAIHALRAGASDFILKPFRVDQILNAIRKCFDRARLLRENFVLRREVAELSGGIEGIVGCSDAMNRLCQMIKRVAGMPSTVLLQGESGVGKEVAARALHSMSPRAQRPFVPVNCGAISPELIESELFGHVKGAFTGASDAHHGLFYYARGGTLFLDEIAELPLSMQAKLLRVLEDRMIRPVGLDVVNIVIPPLRQRREDIVPLASHFAAQLASHLGLPVVPLDADIIARLQSYGWPGNVRELRNLVERSLILGYFPLDALPEEGVSESAASAAALDAVAKSHILEVLAACGGNKSEAARRLGVSRKTVERKLAQWGGQ